MSVGRVAIAILGCAGVLLAAARANGADAVVLQVPLLPLVVGTLAPDSATAPVTTTLIVSSPSSPWALSLLRDNPTPVCEVGSDLDCGDRLLVRSGTEEWRPLIPGVPLRVAAGDGGGDTPVIVELEAQPGWETHVGRRRAIVRAVAGSTVSRPIVVVYDVPPVSQVIPDPRSFDSPSVDPARQTTFAYDPRLYRVVSNTRWRLQVSVPEPLKVRAGLETIDRGLQIITAKGDRVVLLPGSAVTVAAGEPTGSAGVNVPIQLIATPAPGQVGGTYESRIDVAVVSLGN